MSAAATLLERLQNVIPRGSGAWVACCPAHEDRSPSLSICEHRDGTLLVHCFAGCEPGAILKALGLELRHLFPVPLSHRDSRKFHGAHFHAAREAMRAHQRDALIVAIAAGNLAAGVPLEEQDVRLLFAIAGRAKRSAELVL